MWGVKYKVMVPVLRKPGMNIMTSKYVPKWKKVAKPDGTSAWVIRMRLTLRGFQDWFAHLYETYAGTATRQSQRLVASERAARHHEGWIMVTVDVEKVSSKGSHTMRYTKSPEDPGGKCTSRHQPEVRRF